MTCTHASPTPRLRWVPSGCPREHLCSGSSCTFCQLLQLPGEGLANFDAEARSAANLGPRDPPQLPCLPRAEGLPETWSLLP